MLGYQVSMPRCFLPARKHDRIYFSSLSTDDESLDFVVFFSSADLESWLWCFQRLPTASPPPSGGLTGSFTVLLQALLPTGVPHTPCSCSRALAAVTPLVDSVLTRTFSRKRYSLTPCPLSLGITPLLFRCCNFGLYWNPTGLRRLSRLTSM